MTLLGVLLYALTAVEVAGALATALFLLRVTDWGKNPPPKISDQDTYGAFIAWHAGFWWLDAGYLLWRMWRAPGEPPAPAAPAPDEDKAESPAQPWAS